MHGSYDLYTIILPKQLSKKKIFSFFNIVSTIWDYEHFSNWHKEPIRNIFALIVHQIYIWFLSIQPFRRHISRGKKNHHSTQSFLPTREKKCPRITSKSSSFPEKRRYTSRFFSFHRKLREKKASGHFLRDILLYPEGFLRSEFNQSDHEDQSLCKRSLVLIKILFKFF